MLLGFEGRFRNIEWVEMALWHFIVKINGTRYLSKICIGLRINIHKASFISDGIV